MIEAFFLAVALAMDAFAVALTQGARFRPKLAPALAIAGLFGAFQGLMPLGGWALGSLAFAFIAAIDHWIAFLLLGFLGVRMITGAQGEASAPEPLKGLALLVAAIATSIDAFAAGIALPTMAIGPVISAVMIALVTFILSAAGLWSGRLIGSALGHRAEQLGGALLIFLGTKILLEHLEYI